MISQPNALSEHSVYQAIQTYTHELLEQLQLRPESWPHIHPSTYAQIRQALQHQIGALYHFVEARHLTEAAISLRLLGESALWLLDLAWRYKAERFEASSAFLHICAQRPKPLLQYDQLYCTPDSTERRVREVAQDIEGEGGRVLFLGDDDLGSVALASLFSGSIHVCEFDSRVLSFIRAQAEQVQCHEIDLVLGGMMPYLRESFDAVILDPPWDEYHAWCFLHKARYCLKQEPTARIYLSFCPLFLEFAEKKTQPFFERLADVGLTVEKMTPAFHLYALEQTEFMQTLLSHIPDMESPLLRLLCQVPFGFSHLYTLRRTQHFRETWLQRKWLHWWHSR